MKIKLVDGSVYTVSRAEVTNGRLEIDFKDKSCEEIQEVFSNPANLANIELLTEEGDKYADVPGWAVYGAVTLVGDTKTVILTKEIDKVQERLTNAEANALEAATLARDAQGLLESATTQITDLQLALCELYEEKGV